MVRPQAKAAAIVGQAAKQLGAKGNKTGGAKVAMWSMLRELARVLGAKLAPHVGPLIPQAQVRGSAVWVWVVGIWCHVVWCRCGSCACVGAVGVELWA